MEPEAYFERVVRFLETKGWNTSTSQINDSTVVVTGTRESDTYYDRMLTMVGIDEESKLTGEHMEFLREAAAENDVDHMLATCRGGLDDDARRLSENYGIEFIEPGHIDDAFIDGFSLEDSTLSAQDEVVDSIRSESITQELLPLVGFYSLFGAGFATILAGVHLLAVDSEPLTRSLLIGVVVVVSPLLGAVWTGVAGRQTPTVVAVGAAAGHLVVVAVLGLTALALGLVGTAGLFAPVRNLAVFAALALLAGVIGAGTAVLSKHSPPPPGE